jgi:hypothetical protein
LEVHLNFFRKLTWFKCPLLESSGACARPPRPSALVVAKELVTWASGPPPLAASATPTQVVQEEQRFSPDSLLFLFTPDLFYFFLTVPPHP